eukprot:GHVU01075094.1.p1 GENE.GHVU01075094.1~~GHVU01075094.1.p1  ORF type:complete len:176 (-),score=23.68 GHVU01075094.1:360-887(-)
MGSNEASRWQHTQQNLARANELTLAAEAVLSLQSRLNKLDEHRQAAREGVGAIRRGDAPLAGTVWVSVGLGGPFIRESTQKARSRLLRDGSSLSAEIDHVRAERKAALRELQLRRSSSAASSMSQREHGGHGEANGVGDDDCLSPGEVEFLLRDTYTTTTTTNRNRDKAAAAAPQ